MSIVLELGEGMEKSSATGAHSAHIWRRASNEPTPRTADQRLRSRAEWRFTRPQAECALSASPRGGKGLAGGNIVSPRVTRGSEARAPRCSHARAGSPRRAGRCRGWQRGRSTPLGRIRRVRAPRAATARFDLSPCTGELRLLPQTCRRPSPWGSVSLAYSSSTTYETSPFWGDRVEQA